MTDQSTNSTPTEQPAPTYTIARPLGKQELTLDSYLLVVRTDACACGKSHTHSELNEVYVANGARDRVLKPATKVNPSLFVAISRTLPRAIPMCHECIPSSVAVTPADASRAPMSDEWRATLIRKAKQAEDEKVAARIAKRSASPLPSPTIDQL